MPIFPVEALKSLIEALEALIVALEAKLDAWPAERGTDNAELEADADKRAIALALMIDGVETKVDDVEVKLDSPNNFKALAPAYGDIKVYPWAADAVLDADPDYTYTAEVSEGGTSYVEVGHFDFDEDTADIKGIFVNLVWGQKIYGTGFGLVKWQIASGSNASPGAYADITDEVSENLSTYSDHARSGIVHKITGVPSQTPFTIRCVVKNVNAISAQAKIKSNSYIRVAYKRVS